MENTNHAAWKEEEEGSSAWASEASHDEGHFWALLVLLRSRRIGATFYRGGEGSELEQRGGSSTMAAAVFRKDPAALVGDSPAVAMEKCLQGVDGEGNGNGNGNDGERFLPLARLEVALCWIESCHE